ncbi:MAG: hypothetical protein ACYCUI_15695 [Vulcanimicrobiaceae bacterium]
MDKCIPPRNKLTRGLKLPECYVLIEPLIIPEQEEFKKIIHDEYMHKKLEAVEVKKKDKETHTEEDEETIIHLFKKMDLCAQAKVI